MEIGKAPGKSITWLKGTWMSFAPGLSKLIVITLGTRPIACD